MAIRIEGVDDTYDRNGNSPVALAVRWFDAAETEINGDDVVESDQWQALLDRVETVAQVDPDLLLDIARMQQLEESAGPDDPRISLGYIVQLALMNRLLDAKAEKIQATLGRAVLTLE